MKWFILVFCVSWFLFEPFSVALADPLPFSVASLPDLQWWASARHSTLAANPDGSGDILSGGAVGFISDLSGNGRNAIMGESLLTGGDGFRPTFQANFQRGMPAIVFDGADDFLSLGHSLLDGASSATIAFAIQGADASLANRRIWGASDGVHVAGLTFNGNGNPAVGAVLRNGGVAAASAAGGFGMSSSINGDYSMIVVARIRPGGVTDIWENGVLRGSASSPVATNNLIRSIQTKLLGAANGASDATTLTPLAGSYAKFRLLEGFVATSAISDADVGNIYDYLSAQWPGVQNVKGSPNLYWNSATNAQRELTTIDAGHLQGVAVGDGSHFVFHTGMIEKYDASWRLQTNNQNVFAGTPTSYGPLRHVGDGDYFAGKIYAPLEADFGGVGKFIGVYDANSPGLPLIGVRDISAQHQEVSSIVVVPEHGAHGVIYVSSFFAGQGGEKLWMYDLQNGNADSLDFGDFLGTLSIPASITSIQGLEWKAPYFYFSASGEGGNRIERVALTGAELAATSELVVRGATTVQGLAIDGNSAFQAFQGGTTFEYIDELKNAAFSANLPGDVNGDANVDFVDLGILLNHYNQPGAFDWGDFDYSGTVDFSDLGILLNNYNPLAAATAPSAVVPEPSAHILAGVALLCSILRLSMRRRVAALVRSGLCGMAWMSVFSATAQATPIPINLLPLGDSNTAANRGYYIAPLYNMLANNGYLPTYLANEGHSGYIIDGSVSGAPRAGLREHIGAGFVPNYLDHPHVNETNTYVLLMIGTNDVDTGFQLGTAQVQSRMAGLISAIRVEAPLARLIVAQIPPILGTETAVQKFNSDIAAVAVGEQISLVDMYSVFQPDPTPYFADRLHPNQAGGNLMAPVWFAGIEAAVEASRFTGDANRDEKVDIADLGILLNHYNLAGTFSMGDFNRSGVVDFLDLGILLNHYAPSALATSSAGTPTAASVPEPSALVLAGVTLCVIALGSRLAPMRRCRQAPAAVDHAIAID